MSVICALKLGCNMLGRTSVTCNVYTAARSFFSGAYKTITEKSNSHCSASFWPSLRASAASRHFCTTPKSIMSSLRQDASSVATVAVAQMTSVGCQETNFATCRRLAMEAKDLGCCMLFLPECCSFIGLDQRETVAAGQPLDGSAMARFRDLARSTNIWLSLGGFQETGPDPEHIYNTHVVLDGQGQIVASYRKVHLFNVEVHNGPVLMEARSTAPGTELAICNSPAGRLGLTVCYDLRFPEMYQRLTFERGAEVLLVPSAFTRATGKAHWELLLRARAVETQCFVIAAAQAERHNEKRESYGHSLIIDPWGDIIGRLEDPHATGIAVAKLDFQRMRSIRERMPIESHRQQGRKCLGWN
ncbi:hypothetical protein CVIRNUC_002144 [Coccomyxa viridis]|uniref:CN hydrolase domain-containing protein n=1 Tax=Coccomyxa viridis TaxID=1274662 RepID=A0AAV1HWU5_9CHLO|nr:hypothetical protein CVIRNUC_002144 [Coccomyxa viridis]